MRFGVDEFKSTGHSKYMLRVLDGNLFAPLPLFKASAASRRKLLMRTCQGRKATGLSLGSSCGVPPFGPRKVRAKFSHREIDTAISNAVLKLHGSQDIKGSA